MKKITILIFALLYSCMSFCFDGESEILLALQYKKFAECSKLFIKYPSVTLRDLIQLIMKHDRLVDSSDQRMFICLHPRFSKEVTALSVEELLQLNKEICTGSKQNKAERTFFLYWLLFNSKKLEKIEDCISFLDVSATSSYEYLSNMIINSSVEIINLRPSVDQILIMTSKYGKVSSEQMHLVLKESMLSYGLITSIDDYHKIFNFGINNPNGKYIEGVIKLISSTIELYFSLEPSFQDVGKFLRQYYVPYSNYWKDPEFMMKIDSYLMNLKETNGTFDIKSIIDFPFIMKKNFFDRYSNKLNIDLEDIYFLASSEKKSKMIDEWIADILNKYSYENISRGDLLHFQKIIQECIDSENTKIKLQQMLFDNLANFQENYRQDFVFEKLYEKVKDDLPQAGMILKRNDQFSCPICLESEIKGDSLNCPNSECNSKYCPPCFNEFVDFQMKEQKYPISCNQCKKPILLCSNNPKMMDLFYKGTLLYYHDKKYPNSKNCGSVNCVNRITQEEIDDKNNHYKCSSCKMSYCFFCESNHLGKTCKAYLEEVKNTDLFNKILHDPKSNLRPCPWCFVATEKIEACDHITCTKCNQRWDWKFGKDIGPNHYSKTDGSEPREYRIPGEIN